MAVRSPPHSSCSDSSTTRRGRISTLREPRWGRRKPKSITAGVRATAFACWSGWLRNITKPRNNYSVFERSMPPDLIRGWTPVRVKKTRQNKRVEPGSDSIRTDKALAQQLEQQCDKLG